MKRSPIQQFFRGLHVLLFSFCCGMLLPMLQAAQSSDPSAQLVKKEQTLPPDEQQALDQTALQSEKQPAQADNTPQIEGIDQLSLDENEITLPSFDGLEQELDKELAIIETDSALETPELEFDQTSSEDAMSTSFDLDIPYLGKMTLLGTADIFKNKYSLSTQTPSVSLGPLILSPGTIMLSNDLGLTATTRADLYGFTSAVGLDHIQMYEEGLEASFTITFDKTVDLPITPWKIIPLKKFNLRLAGSKRELTTQSTLEKENDIKMILDLGYADYARLTVDQAHLNTLIDVGDEDILRTIVLNNNVVEMHHPFKSGMRKTTLYADLDSTQLNLPFITGLTSMKITGTIDAYGFIVEGELPPVVTIKDLGPLKKGRIFISNKANLFAARLNPLDNPGASLLIPEQFRMTQSLKDTGATKGRVFITVQGDTTLSLPLDLGDVDTTLTATIQKNKFTASALIHKNVEVLGSKLLNPYIMFSSDGTREIVGGMKINGIEAYGHLQIQKVQGVPKTTFYATLQDQKPIKPFENIPGIGDVKELADISLNNIRAGISQKGAQKTMLLQGESQILGIQTQARLINTQKYTALWAKTPPNFPVAKIIPCAEGSPISNLNFKDFWIVAASQKYFDDQLLVDIPKGLALVAKVVTNEGPLAQIQQVFSGMPEVINMTVQLGKSPKNTYCVISIPTDIRLSQYARISQGVIEIGGIPPTIGGYATMEITPTPHDKLLFSTQFKLDAKKLAFAGTLAGMWKDPFGLKGFSIGNVALEIGAVFTAVPPLPLFGITGEMAIGDQKMAMALKVSPDGDENILMGKLSKLGIQDIIKLVNNVMQEAKLPAGSTIPLDKIPLIELRDIEFTMAPRGGRIGLIQFEPGFTARGELTIGNLFWAKINININMFGVTIEGTAKEINLGPLQITGKGFDKKYGTADDGPIVRCVFNTKEQQAYISGKVKLLGMEAETDILIDSHTFKFQITSKILNLFSTELLVESIGSGKDIDFHLKAEMKNDLIDYVQQKAKIAITEYQQNAKRDIGGAQDKVKNINKEIDKLEAQIKERENKIENQKRIIAQKTTALKNKVAAPRKKLEAMERDVKTIDTKINNLKNRINDLKHKLSAVERIDQLTPSWIEPTIRYAHLTSDPHLERNQLLSLFDESHLQELFYHKQVHLVSIGDWFRKAASTLKSGFEKAGNAIKDTTLKAVDTLKGTAEKVGTAIKDTTLDAVAKTKYTGELIGASTELAGLEAARFGALLGLKAAQEVLKAAEAVAQDPTIIEDGLKITQWGIEIAGLKIGTGPLYAARETADKTLEGAKEIAVGIGEAGKWLSEATGDILNIRHMLLEGRLRDITTGKLPRMQIDAVVLGKQKNIDIQFDFGNMAKSIEDIVKAIATLIAPV